MSNTTFDRDNFCVIIDDNQDRIDAYKELCKTHNLIYREHWSGCFRYYGVINGREHCSDFDCDLEIMTLDRFELRLLQSDNTVVPKSNNRILLLS